MVLRKKILLDLFNFPLTSSFTIWLYMVQVLFWVNNGISEDIEVVVMQFK